MYSGGVDSILCLKWLRDHDIVPALFHFKTLKLKRRHERMIRKTAKILSPESPFYVFKTKTNDFNAYWARGEYGVWLTDKRAEIVLIPQYYGDIVVIGYTGYDSNDGRCKLPTQKLSIEETKIYGFPFMFPMAGIRKSQINQLFDELPRMIRENTVSSTRFFKGEWEVVPKKCANLYEEYTRWKKHGVS